MHTRMASLSSRDRVAYRFLKGKDNAPVLVFLHGLACDMDCWQKQEAALADQANLLFIDFPGHGQSTDPVDADPSILLLKNAVRSVLDDVGITKAIFIGHSMGGLVAAALYRSSPELFLGFVSIDAPIHPWRMTPVPKFVSWLLKTPLAKPLLRKSGASFTNAHTPEWVEAYISARLVENSRGSAGALIADFASYTNEPVFYKVPVLAIHAGGFLYGDPSHEEKSNAVGDDVHYVLVRDSAHFVMMEKDGLVNKLIESFISRVC